MALRLKTAISLGLRAGQDLPQVLHRACDGFADEPARFATVVVVVADPRTRTLEWVNAGHPAPRIVRGDGRIEQLPPTGPMLSWLIGEWTLARTELGPTEVCLAFTDGILESRDESGDELGDDGLDRQVRLAAAGTRDPAELTARLLGSVRQRTHDIGRDDLTAGRARVAGTGHRRSGEVTAVGASSRRRLRRRGPPEPLVRWRCDAPRYCRKPPDWCAHSPA